MGLSVAYNLAKRHGLTNVSVLDATYLCGGASGRNAAAFAHSGPTRPTSG
jgi:glycine/D-amino acid oxidase-like deaminating enzyme